MKYLFIGLALALSACTGDKLACARSPYSTGFDTMVPGANNGSNAYADYPGATGGAACK